MENTFLTIPEFLKKYDIADSKIRRRLYRMKLVDLAKYQEIVKEVKTYFGYIIQLDEIWWARELKAKSRKEDKVETNRISEPDKPIIETPNRSSNDFIEFMKKDIEDWKQQARESKEQVSDFLERYRELNLLLNGLQTRLFLLESRTTSRTQEQKEEEKPKEEVKKVEVVEPTKEEIKKEN